MLEQQLNFAQKGVKPFRNGRFLPSWKILFAVRSVKLLCHQDTCVGCWTLCLTLDRQASAKRRLVLVSAVAFISHAHHQRPWIAVNMEGVTTKQAGPIHTTVLPALCEGFDPLCLFVSLFLFVPRLSFFQHLQRGPNVLVNPPLHPWFGMAFPGGGGQSSSEAIQSIRKLSPSQQNQDGC